MVEKIIIDWAIQTLNNLDYVVLGEPEMVRSMPWSQVARFYTKSGVVYLKTLAEPFSQEAKLLKFLNSIGIDFIPKVIAVNTDERCFLMEEAGETLRNRLKVNYDHAFPSQALNVYANLQIKCIPYVHQLLNMGIYDWRLEKLPKLYMNFLCQEAMLKQDGLSEQELQNLKNFYPNFVILCEKLASFNIPETLEHGDFQDNNILIKHNKIILHDFGDATITHPFFSLASFLYSATRHHDIHENGHIYTLFFNSYMQPWQNFISPQELLEAFNLAKQIGRFVFALSFARIKSCEGIEAFPEYNGYITEALKLLYQH